MMVLLPQYFLLPARGSAGASDPPPARPPLRMGLEEARRTTRLMNDIYVIGVLTAHEMYVREPGNPAAVSWGKQVIRQVRAKGWPEAHIFDTTGRPLNPDNNPQDPFEREAGAEFKRGKSSVEKVDGRLYRYATSLRIADQSCLGCHVRNKVGDLLGGISFKIELQDTRR